MNTSSTKPRLLGVFGEKGNGFRVAETTVSCHFPSTNRIKFMTPSRKITKTCGNEVCFTLFHHCHSEKTICKKIKKLIFHNIAMLGISQGRPWYFNLSGVLAFPVRSQFSRSMNSPKCYGKLIFFSTFQSLNHVKT